MVVPERIYSTHQLMEATAAACKNLSDQLAVLSILDSTADSWPAINATVADLKHVSKEAVAKLIAADKSLESLSAQLEVRLAHFIPPIPGMLHYIRACCHIHSENTALETQYMSRGLSGHLVFFYLYTRSTSSAFLHLTRPKKKCFGDVLHQFSIAVLYENWWNTSPKYVNGRAHACC